MAESREEEQRVEVSRRKERNERKEVQKTRRTVRVADDMVRYSSLP